MRRFRRPARVWILLLSTAFLCAQREPLAGLRRLSDVPIIAPRGNGWEAAGTFNPALSSTEARSSCCTVRRTSTGPPA